MKLTFCNSCFKYHDEGICPELQDFDIDCHFIENSGINKINLSLKDEIEKLEDKLKKYE